jgi:hypothetical protein
VCLKHPLQHNPCGFRVIDNERSLIQWIILPESPLKPKPAANPLNYVTKYEKSGADVDSLPTMIAG